jgi:membrane protease YdiL (CAAX protease family)
MEEQEIDPNTEKQVDFIKQLIALAGISLLASVLGFLIISPLTGLFGMSNFDLALKEIQAGKFPELLNPIRILFIIMHGCTFIVPALAFVAFYWRKQIAKTLYLAKLPALKTFAWSLLFVVVALPVVNVLHYFNTLIPDAWQSQEAGTLQKMLLRMETPVDFMLNLMLIGVMAAVGEELLFRGVIQRIFAVRYQNMHLAIWGAAIAFSLVHFELQAFLPRLVLGGMFGYVFWWSSNLWIPIILHFLYNGVQVLAVYQNPELVETASPSLDVWLLVAAAGGAIFIIPIAKYLHRKSLETNTQLSDNQYLENPSKNN